MRVLVLEDDPSLLTIASFSLRAFAKCEVIEAETAWEGIRLAVTERPAAILCDVHLPDMDGLEAVAFLRRDPSTAGIPVLLFTASPETLDADRLQELGILGTVKKPFDPREMGARLIEAVMKGKSAPASEPVEEAAAA